MSHYDDFERAHKYMRNIDDRITHHKSEIAKLEELYLEQEADATIAYNAMLADGVIDSGFYEKTNIE